MGRSSKNPLCVFGVALADEAPLAAVFGGGGGTEPELEFGGVRPVAGAVGGLDEGCAN